MGGKRGTSPLTPALIEDVALDRFLFDSSFIATSE